MKTAAVGASRKRKKTKREYPIIDGHRRQYVRYPVQGRDGKFRAADVLLTGNGGYIDPEKQPWKVGTKSLKECQKWCDAHNEWIGVSKDEANQIIHESMELSRKPEKIG